MEGAVKNMNIFGDSKPEEVISYVSAPREGVSVFPVERTVRAQMFIKDRKIYFRTNEIAHLLGVHQQSQFTSSIRKKEGAGAVLSGKDTEDFRTPSDTPKTTFVEAKTLAGYLRKAMPYKDAEKQNMAVRIVDAIEHIRR